MLVENSSAENGLTRNSRAPAEMDRFSCSASPWTLIMMIGEVGRRCEMISAAATPSMPGMLMSMIDDVRAQLHGPWIASSPEPASPATSIPSSRLEELREVIARLRDVVDDQDLDHVIGPRSRVACSLARAIGCATCGVWVASTMMSGIGTPYSSTRSFSVIPVVGPRRPRRVFRCGAATAVSGTDLVEVALRELDQLGVLVAAGEDDDHAVDGARLASAADALALGVPVTAARARVWLTYRTRWSWMIVLTVRTLLRPVTAS